LFWRERFCGAEASPAAILAEWSAPPHAGHNFNLPAVDSGLEKQLSVHLQVTKYIICVCDLSIAIALSQDRRWSDQTSDLLTTGEKKTGYSVQVSFQVTDPLYKQN